MSLTPYTFPVGGILLHMVADEDHKPLRYEMWTIKAKRRLANGNLSVVMIAAVRGVQMTKTVRFKDGKLGGVHWRAAQLGDTDLALAWGGGRRV